MANLSILGLYGYDSTLFDNLLLPSAIDKDTVIDNLMAETAELECLYSDPDFMKAMIGIWSKKELPVWTHMYETTQYEYNPIWNKDGKVTETVSDSKTNTSNQSSSGTSSASADSTVTRTEDLDAQHKVAAFNESSAQLASQDLGDNEINDTSNTETSASTSTTLRNTDNEVFKHSFERIEQGNIGITTTQSMIREERDIAEFNVIDYIIKSFKQRFCLQVY